jgi:PHD/YefM family antitoxin component YafN of YafNO toxin-antitoxin module
MSIARKKDQAVATVSLEDHESIDETSYLLRVAVNG